MGTLQNITVAGLVADLGLTGHKGIATAIHSADHTKLDVTVTQPAWVLLGGGTLFTTDLVNKTVQAPTTDGDYRLYVDAVAQVTAIVPMWTIAASAPSVNAIAIADVTVASHVISTVTVRDEGLRSLPVQASALPAPAGVSVLYGPYTVDYTDIPHDGDKKTLWTPQVGDVLLRLFPDYQTVMQWDQGMLFIGQDVDCVSPPGPGAWKNVFAMAQAGHIGGSLSDPLDTITCLIAGNTGNASGVALGTTAYVCQTTDPMQIQLAQTGGTDPGAGHVELYALIARAVAP